MSGLGTIRLRSDLPESQVLYISYENEVRNFVTTIMLVRVCGGGGGGGGGGGKPCSSRPPLPHM